VWICGSRILSAFLLLKCSTLFEAFARFEAKIAEDCLFVNEEGEFIE
jgi:hypothetical protein